MLLLVLFPYLKNTLFEYRQRYKLDELEGHAPQTKWQRLYRACVIRGYTIGFMFYEILVLFNYILYISGKSQYPTPTLKLLSISLTYSESEPIVSVSELLRKIKNNSFGLSDSVDILQRMVTRSLELGAFFLQFLSWWNEENYNTNIMSLPVPPPPKIPEIAKQYKGICPICCKKQHIHTLLSVSGYVFCYQCILPMVRTHKKCPVTHYPAKEDDLIRLYIE